MNIIELRRKGLRLLALLLVWVLLLGCAAETTTQQSTEEIQDMIERLQSDSARAVDVMERGRNQAEACVTQSDEASLALNAISESVHQASDSSTAIATAAEQQSATAHDISEKLEAIVVLAEQAEVGAQQTSQASDEVAKLSAEMQDSVKTFRL